jgi:hypothetical protein
MIKKRKGLALIAAIMLIVFVSIAVLGVTTFIVQWFKQLNADQIRLKCLYLAQAGIQDAIYEVRATYKNPATTYGSFTTGLSTVNTGETYRRGGTAADFLMVKTAGATWTAGTYTLSGINVQKAISSASPVVTIASVNVCWTKSSATARNLTKIVLSSTWNGTLASSACPGGNVNITDVALTTSFIPLSLTWANSITLTNVTVQFNMLDGSTKTVVIFPASNSCQFSISSTGKVAGSNIFRTIEATYDLMPTTYATTSRIVDVDEMDNEITSP